jgi:uncharacterized flavoprotein (TIGR03862 family)
MRFLTENFKRIESGGMTLKPSPPKIRVGIIGSGPTGLMAAACLADRPEFRVDLFERRAGFGRKLLVAGSSGLNISHDLPLGDFAAHYSGWTQKFWADLLTDFGPKEWISFIEQKLGLETFVGTSHRYFVREMKASGLLASWRRHLEKGGVTFHGNSEFRNFSPDGKGYRLDFSKGADSIYVDHIIFALGGGSWEDSPPTWPEVLKEKNIETRPFSAANVGRAVQWSGKFLMEAEGKPLKKIRFGNARGEKDGELVVTKYGLEGTPIYFHGEKGPAWIDLKPDLTRDAILLRLNAVRENLSPIRRVKQKLELCEASQALLFHHLPDEDRRDLETLVLRIKRFPIVLGESRPLSEAISSKGGVALGEVRDSLELNKFPGVYVGGEMLDWHAPTGGFLIQAAVSMGARIGKSLLAAKNIS